jgi:Tol biopolymer transport system component
MNADGSGVTQLTHGNSFADHPRMTADGRYVVYESRKGGNWEIRRIGIDGTGEVNLTRSRATDRFPAVSPNGRLVAFSSNRGTSGTHIWVMSVQGRVLKRVTVRRGNQFEPAWAPAGGRLAYVSGTLSAGTNIWTVLANGTGDRRLTAVRADEQLNPSWSPDARSIVYGDCLVSNTGACTLSVMPLGGSAVDISPLRTPLLDTFDGGYSRLWQPWQFGTGATNTEANGKLTTTLTADSTQAASTTTSKRTGATVAA